MASCCPPGSAPYLASDHEDEGSVRSVNDVHFYHVGSGERGLLLIPDVWGWNGGRTRAIADNLAKKGLSVWVPRILSPPVEGGTDGDGLPPAFDLGSRGGELGPLFGGDWGSEAVLPKVQEVVRAMKAGGVKKMGIVGFCYGAWIGMKLATKDCPINVVACASPHPSLHIEGMLGGDPVELAKESTAPWAFFPCGEVGAAGADPDMYDVDGGVFKALEEKFPGKNVTKRFTAMKHGFVARGNIKDDEFNVGRGTEVLEAVEECMGDILIFLVKRGLTSRARALLPALPPKLRKPKFTKVDKISPEASGLNLLLKCVSCEEVANDSAKVWEAVLGDETGVVTFSLRNQALAEMCVPGCSIRVQNARVLMLKGHIRVIIDKWGVMKASDEPLAFEVSDAVNVSGTEFELV